MFNIVILIFPSLTTNFTFLSKNPSNIEVPCLPSAYKALNPKVYSPSSNLSVSE